MGRQGFQWKHISIHPPRAGRDDEEMKALIGTVQFQSTRPVRGGTQRVTCAISAAEFQSTRPVRGGTAQPVTTNSPSLFQSTRPVRGGTRVG